MAPLSPDNTDRYRFHYTVTSHSHTMEIRSAGGVIIAASVVNNLLTALDTDIFSLVIDFVEFAPMGSSIFNPVVSPIDGNTYGSGAGTTEQVANFINFIARSTGGRRLRLAVFGIIGMGTDYRFIAGEDALVDDAIASLVFAGGNITCIDGLTPVWKSYANAGRNAYWQKALRP
jgi:hypothetical protein